jgi:hypothetical protein
MWRIRSAVPGHIRVFLALLLVGAWQAEGLLIQLVIGSHAVVARLSAIEAAASGAASVAGSFLSDGFAFIRATIVRRFDLLPSAVRNVIPFALLSSLGRGLTALFGWHAWQVFVSDIFTLGVEAIRLLLALNLAGWTYNFVRRTGRQVLGAMMLPVRFYADHETADDAAAPAVQPIAGQVGGQRRKEYVEFFGGHVESIGIILPGGGARGVYQAGALKAVYDFLRDYNALGKVRMIVGTSTGAWNAMFWMAGLVDPSQGVSLETWWKQKKFSRLMEFPRFWLPFLSDHCFSNAPWREQFEELFGGRLDHLFTASPKLHFYLTRTDIPQGALRYATNWSGLKQRVQTLGLENQDNYRLVDVIGADGREFARMADAVFGSMGQAPLFPGHCEGVPCESGDALDPLPLRFAAPVEDCDLVFVLPSRGSPEKLGESRVSRLSRVAHVQQIALERFAVKNADTINRIAERFERLEFGARTIAAAAGVVGVAAEAASGVREEIDEFSHAYKRLYVFTACPAGSLAINSFDYSQEREAAAAFDLMYTQTSDELRHRLFEDIEPEDAHVVMVDGLVSPTGESVKPTYRRPNQF